MVLNVMCYFFFWETV